VALENLRTQVSARRRLLVVVGFGLLHGQGFAAALIESGLSRQAFLLSLLSFNVGVELGQLVVVLVLTGALLFIRDPARRQRYAVRPGSVAIALIGLAWGLARVFGA